MNCDVSMKQDWHCIQTADLKVKDTFPLFLAPTVVLCARWMLLFTENGQFLPNKSSSALCLWICGFQLQFYTVLRLLLLLFLFRAFLLWWSNDVFITDFSHSMKIACAQIISLQLWKAITTTTATIKRNHCINCWNESFCAVQINSVREKNSKYELQIASIMQCVGVVVQQITGANCTNAVKMHRTRKHTKAHKRQTQCNISPNSVLSFNCRSIHN